MSDSTASDSRAQPKRRFLDRHKSSPTLVGAGARFDGDLDCSGDLSVAGQVVGNGQIQGMLSLADSGNWRGVIHCATALVAGQIHGQLVVNGKLEIRSSARLTGQIAAQQLAIAEGAIIEAEITVLSDLPIQHFSERRSD